MPNLVNYWMEPDDDFFKRVEECGGWPMHMKFVTMGHTAERGRPCYFTEKSIRDNWSTTMYSRDDYLWWKLSPERKKAEADKVRTEFANQIRRLA